MPETDVVPATGFLQNAGSAERALLSQMAAPVRLRPDEVLFLQNDGYRGFFAVVEGAVKLYRDGPAGRQLVLQVARAGEIFGEAALCRRPEEGRYYFSARALTSARLLFFPAAPAAAFVRARPELFEALMQQMAATLERTTEHLDAVTLYTVKSRVARFLLEHARPSGADGAPVVHLEMRKTLLAAYLGTVPETLSRAFRALIDAGLIRGEQNEIVLLDPARLREEAEGGRDEREG